MAEKAPNSYKDPYWSDLSSRTEQRLGLPSGLLANVVTKGERSNADQVSEAGARTVFQVTPSTRKLVMDKYGVDAYLSPENAAEAAGLLLKESLERNKGDVSAAVSEYHGGTDRANWGPRTRAYVDRVISGQQAAPAPAQSTFQRALQAQQPSVTPNAIAQVYEAYKSGQMTPEESAEFEADVNSGVVMLPRGATLAGEQSRAPTELPEPFMLPPEVTDAYQTGKLSPQERADLEADIQAGIVQLAIPPDQLPEFDESGVIVQQQPGVIPQQPEPTIGEQIVGAGEAGLALGTGATGGALGMIGGTLKGLAEQILSGQFGTQEAADLVEQSAMQGAEALTYQPRTQAGQRITQAIGEAAAPLVAATPLGQEIGAITRGAQAAAPAVRAAAQPAIQAGQRVAQAVTRPVATSADKLRNILPGRQQPSAAPSAGAAGTGLETVRREKAAGLPVPIRLTVGEATRDPDLLEFEKSQIKTPEGELLRQHANENNVKALQNFEALIDLTEASAPDLISSGNKAIDALSKGWKNAKAETSAANIAARKSPEADRQVDVLTPVRFGEGDREFNGTLVDYLNSRPRGVPSAAVTDSTRQIMRQLGLANEDAEGNLVANPATVAQMEDLRRELSGIANRAEPVQIRDETLLKKIIDAQTGPVAGELFKKARALRTQQGRKYENRSIVANLITNRRGMDDPKVAADEVLRRSILNASPEEVTFLKRVMLTSGEDGKQAWKDIQGALINHIKEEATKGMQLDANDQPIVSGARLNAVINQLDRNDRLDIVLGKENANRVRDLNDVLKYINTVPPGTLINNSGTTRALLAALAEAGTLGSTVGLPIPVISTLKFLSNEVKSAKIRAKIKKALEEPKERQ